MDMGQYLDRTKNLRGSENGIFINMKKPHSKVGRYTIRRWTKMGLRLSGIDLNICNAHSTRSAATSKAVSKGVSLRTILKTAGWRRAATFARFYHKEVVEEEDLARILDD